MRGSGAPTALDMSEDQRRGRLPAWFPTFVWTVPGPFPGSPRWSPGLWSPPCCAPSSLHPTPTPALVLLVTRRPSWALQEARLTLTGRRAGHRAGLGPQCPCQVLPAWGCVGSWGHPGGLRASRAPGDHGRGSDPGAQAGPEGTDPARAASAPPWSSQPRCAGPPGSPRSPSEPPPRTHSQSDVFNETPADEPVGLGCECSAKGPAVPEMAPFPFSFWVAWDSLRAHLFLVAVAAEGRAGSGGDGLGKRRGPESISASTQTCGGGCSLLSDRRPMGN